MKRSAIFFLYIVIIAGCRKTPDTKPNGREIYVSSTSSGTFTKETLQALAVLKGYGSYVSQMKYDVDFFKIVYNTTYKGKSIEASGLLAVPKNTPTAHVATVAQMGNIAFRSGQKLQWDETHHAFTDKKINKDYMMKAYHNGYKLSKV